MGLHLKHLHVVTCINGSSTLHIKILTCYIFKPYRLCSLIYHIFSWAHSFGNYLCSIFRFPCTYCSVDLCLSFGHCIVWLPLCYVNIVHTESFTISMRSYIGSYHNTDMVRWGTECELTNGVLMAIRCKQFRCQSWHYASHFNCCTHHHKITAFTRIVGYIKHKCHIL